MLEHEGVWDPSNCSDMCKDMENCVGWRFLPHSESCFLMDVVEFHPIFADQLVSGNCTR